MVGGSQLIIRCKEAIVMTQEDDKRTLINTVSSIPPSVWVFLIGQMVAGAYWLIRLDSRVQENTKIVIEMEERVRQIDLVQKRVDVITNYLIGRVVVPIPPPSKEEPRPPLQSPP